METLEILSDEKAMKSIRKSIKEAHDGKWLDFDEVFAEWKNRVVYNINDEENFLQIYHIGHRKDIYEIFGEQLRELENRTWDYIRCYSTNQWINYRQRKIRI